MDYPNIHNTFEELQEYYDLHLNKDTSLVKTTNDEPTPLDCVIEMVDKIPNYVWENASTKILDPCCGCGNFFVVILQKLRKYHDDKHILENMLYFNDLNNDRLDIVKQVFDADNYQLNITYKDFLEYDEDLNNTFDVIVANPPYAKLMPNGKRASKNHNMIGSFISKTLKLLSQKGFMLYISPDNWMSYANRNTLIGELTSLQIHHIDIHRAKRYFKKVGSSFVWYLIENTPAYMDFTISGIWKKMEYTSTVKSERRNYIPLYYTGIVQNIMNKTIDVQCKKFNVETSSNLHRYTKRHLISTTEDDTHCHRLIHTPSTTVWSCQPHKYQDGYKVFIPTTSYYDAFVDNCGMTQSIAFIRCKDKQHAENICKVLKHPMYKFINDICRFGNFNNIRILQNFPYCEHYDDVYSMFGITDDEIDVIEKYT